ncbi:MAG: PleD family two-component system response regulator [Coleofasciculaceae cyanobacterium]
MTVEPADKNTILIVDDNPTSLRVLFNFLVDAGFQVLEAHDGNSAIELATKVRPDLIILDVIMPGIDGFETCRRLKACQSTQDIPVMFMTALSQTAVVVKGLELGAVDYIIKPTQQEIVVARLTTHLTLQKLRHNLEEQNAQLQLEIQQRQQAELALQEANQKLKRLATLDGLTQVANRRRFDQYLSQGWNILIREKLPLSLVMCDIDFFKLYNDNNGHQAGDKCLQQVTRAIRQVVKRAADLVARYGGEEFAVILPHTNSKGALKVAEQIRASIREMSIPHRQSPVSQYVTLSLGVSSTIPSLESSPEMLIAAADQALYQAKLSGRDRAIFAPTAALENQDVSVRESTTNSSTVASPRKMI